jgi:hypothetical protein
LLHIEKDREEVQKTSEELKILIEALCNRIGKSTVDFKKSKENAQQKAIGKKKNPPKGKQLNLLNQNLTVNLRRIFA